MESVEQILIRLAELHPEWSAETELYHQGPKGEGGRGVYVSFCAHLFTPDRGLWRIQAHVFDAPSLREGHASVIAQVAAGIEAGAWEKPDPQPTTEEVTHAIAG